MSIVLTTEQREQAGSDSYDKFEYQNHWIVCHIIGKLQDNTECMSKKYDVYIMTISNWGGRVFLME